MSIVIRHGSNGGYKTATAVQDYIKPAALNGRVVVTNIRGITRERFFDVLGDEVSEKFDVIYVDTETKDGKDEVKKWFHWVPLGALIVFDEASTLFPKKMSQKEIDNLSFPHGADYAKRQGRPATWLEAWEMHRHYNWDIVLTTPSIKSIRDDIRDTTEMAFRHRNLATAGKIFSGRYKEAQHDAVNNGTSLSNFITVNTRKINKQTFELYESTTTGKAKDTTSGKSIFYSIPLVLAFSVFAFFVIRLFNAGGVDTSSTINVKENVSSGIPIYNENNQIYNNDNNVSISNNDSNNVYVGKNNSVDDIEPFGGYYLWNVGNIKTSKYHKVLFEYQSIDIKYKDVVRQITAKDMINMGYQITALSDCIYKVKYNNKERIVNCIPPVFEAEQASEGSQRAREA